MPKRTIPTTVDYLVNSALPEFTDSYTVIPHGDIIHKVKTVLRDKGYVILREMYRCNEGAKIATGIYHLESTRDPDMGMLFTWSNSYDKTQKFRCSIGGYIHASLAAVIGGNMGTFGRKHTGDANIEVDAVIAEQIENADKYFDQLIADKEAMKKITLSEDERAAVMGKFYFINEVLTGEQLAICKKEFKKPSFEYTGQENSVWRMYNSIIFALQTAHPRTWLDQQRIVHYHLVNDFIFSARSEAVNTEPDEVTVEIDPKQINLIDSIKEIEAEKESNISSEHVFMDLSTNDETISVKPDPELSIGASPAVGFTEGGQPLVQPEKPNPIVNLSETDKLAEENLKGITEDGKISEEDDTWVCLGCGKTQTAADIFYDGQLCKDCNDKK